MSGPKPSQTTTSYVKPLIDSNNNFCAIQNIDYSERPTISFQNSVNQINSNQIRNNVNQTSEFYQNTNCSTTSQTSANYTGTNYPGTNYQGANYPGTNHQGANYPGTNYLIANQPSAQSVNIPSINPNVNAPFINPIVNPIINNPGAYNPGIQIPNAPNPNNISVPNVCVPNNSGFINNNNCLNDNANNDYESETIYESDASEDDASRSDTPDRNSINNNSFERLMGFKKLFSYLSDKFPEKFDSNNPETPYYNTRRMARSAASGRHPLNVPHLLIDPPLSGSWFDPPHSNHPDDSSKTWSDSSGFPPSKSRICPKNYDLTAKAPCPYTRVVDKDLKALFEATSFKQATLDHAAFDKTSVDIANSSHTKLDSMLRPALLDSFASDELLQMALSLLENLEMQFQGNPAISVTLDAILSTLELVAENNQRSGQHILASYVANKVFIRDSILKKFVVPTIARNLLRGSSCKSDKVFGPLPESFRSALLHPNGKELRCVSSFRHRATTFSSSKTSKPASGYKRSLPQPSSTKRFKGKSTSSFFRTKSRSKK